MKKIALAVVVCMAMVAMTSALVLAAAQKVELVPCPSNYPVAPFPPGGGFVIFNNPKGEDHNLMVQVSLKGVEPRTAYDIYLFVDQGITGTKIGTVTTNKKGNANFHMNGSLDPGTHVLALDVILAGDPKGLDVYETDGIHSVPMEGPSLNFE